MISTIRGRKADGSRRTIGRSDQLNLPLETTLGIYITELLLDDDSLSNVIDDSKLWFMSLEVLHSIYD
jgi:hypothetical protein